ncbi:MAG: hypothetical protein KME16_22465 [Scytolyngbya sp. HA4215-MV1]|nr:hypothetical protein [Scytolyngbya sp. HA4215-MV1]
MNTNHPVSNVLQILQVEPDLSIPVLVSQILSRGHITPQEHFHLTSTLLSNRRVTQDDRAQINRILDDLQMGRLKLTH